MKKMMLTLWAVLAFVQFSHAGFDIKGVLGAGNDALKAVTLSEQEVNQEASRAIGYYDGQNSVASASSEYAIRLAKIIKGMETDSNKKFDIKVYLVSDVNAFAMANGSIRIYSGLMDIMTDDEVRYVIGHEIGHVALGHSKKKLQMAHAATAGRKLGSASGNEAVVALSESEMGDFAEKLVNAQFSQSQEMDADQFAFKMMKKKGYDLKSAPNALRKLEKLYGNEKSLFASHPAPGERAAALEKLL